MGRQFNHPNGSVLIEAGDLQFLASDLLCKCFVQSIVAGKNLRCLIVCVNLVCPAAGNNSQTSFLSNKGAG